MTDRPVTQAHPLLVRFAVPRHGNAELPGRYCKDLAVWVVAKNGSDVPLIDAARDLAEITTKTKVEVEVDDTRDIAALEIQTKTASRVERDDDILTATSLLAATTKTMVIQEQDQADRMSHALLEVTTKTEAELERDDVTRELSMMEAEGVSRPPVH